MVGGTNYTYNITINPPDKIGSVINAILSFNAQINGQTQSFSLWVNKQPCNPASYSVATAFSTTGNVQFYFDCSEQIRKAGFYNITFSSAVATGAITGWLDFTYMTNATDYVAGVGLVNKCTAVDNVSLVETVSSVDKVSSVDMINQGKIEVHGTEYVIGDYGKLWLQLLSANNTAITSAICYIDVYTPLNGQFIERATMTNMVHDGIYYYDMIVPSIQGVYPAIATCYFIAYQDKRLATSYAITSGKLDAGSLSDTYTLNSVYLTIKTDKNGGLTANNRVNASFNFSNVYANCGNVSESLLTGISFYWNGVWNTGTGTHHINLYTYNYSSGSWLSLPNNIQGGFGGTVQTITNSIPMNNITKALGINATRPVQFRVVDTDINEGAKNFQTDYMYASCDQLASPGWQEVKGSSEMHIRGNNGNNFGISTLCGDERTNCAKLLHNPSVIDESQGYILENITFTNYYPNIILSSTYDYETALGLDCTGILEIKKYVNGVMTDIYNDSFFEIGNNENCVLTMPIDFDAGVSSYYIEIFMDNYPKWEVTWYKDMVKFYNETISNYCLPLGITNGYTFDVPLTYNLTESNLQLVACHRSLDDIYYFSKNYVESLSVGSIGDYESYLAEARFYYPLIRSHYADTKQTMILNLTGQIFNDTGTSLDEIRNKIHLRVWNNTVRNLTYYPTQTDLTDYQKTANYVWNQTSRNLTYYPDMTNYTKVAEAVWGWQGSIAGNILDAFAGWFWQFQGIVKEVLS